MNGSAAWQLTSTTLSVSYDAGAHWSPVPLPAGVTPKAIATVTAAPGRGVWLGVPDGAAFEVYHRAATTWTHTRLIPNTRGEVVAGGGPMVAITLQPHGIVSVVAGWGMTGTSAVESLFVSDNDGASFTEHPGIAPHYLDVVTFLDTRHAVAVIGPPGVDAPVYRSVDGGATWTHVALPVGNTQIMPGTPATAGGTVLLPVLVDRGDAGVQVVVLRSTNFGATFVRTSEPLDVPAADSAGYPEMGEDGATIWLPARGRIYETTDAGEHWRSVATNAPVEAIGLDGGSRAIAVLSDDGCRQFKRDCYLYSYLVTTSDGGRTWQTASG